MTIQTSNYKDISNERGYAILERMEAPDKPWEVVLADEADITPGDFANWLTKAQDRKDRFSAIRERQK